MKAFIKKSLPNFLIGTASLLAMWLVWLIAEKTVKNEYVIPSLSITISALWQTLKQAFFWQALVKTLLKVVYSFGISFLLAGTLAVLGHVFKPFGKFLKPIISVIRTLPTMAILVLILIYTTKTTAPVIVASLVLFPMIYAQFTTALEGIDDGLITTVKAFKLNKKTKIFKIFLPMTAPEVLSHVGTNLSFAIKLVISAEIMAYSYTSIGGMMQAANAYMDVPKLMALTLVAIILGLVIELIFHLIFIKAFKWTKAEGNND